MQKIGDITNTATPEGEFTDGNVSGGVVPTLLLAAIFNTWQRELCNIVTGLGSKLDSKDDGQLLKVLKKSFAENTDSLGALAALTGVADSIPYFTGPESASLTNLTKVGREIIAQPAVTDVLKYLGLGTTATKNVGTGSGQIPDMSSFNTGNTNSFRLPTGHFVQFGSGQTISGGFTQSYPTPFPTICQALLGVVYSTLGVRAFIATNTSDRTAANMNVVDQNGNGINVTVGYIAIGR
ncbi:hypothetical protein HV353_21845 (plasmid) [Enterobacter roggenkampii]|uniref:gp53-like domain-containing protein n=1 Tax=Enterobacter roggenkampii TaxID=1812935 RepID=UPI0015F9A1E6|nr:hypothetical protein [Enterobacter roggenkampii]MBA7745196.1 hypothetical protein [Enterobacter roggenkampii]